MNPAPINNQYTSLRVCLCCGKDSLLLVLDLSTQPLANSSHANTEQLPEFPLALNVCPNCFHSQQAVAVHPDLMFRNYLYVSGTSKTLRDYFAWFAEKVDTNFEHGVSKEVLDIACNDGTQLKEFVARGWKAWGVDPAENLVDQARATGATVECDYWNNDVAEKLNKTFDIVLAQNVFAHTNNPLEFLLACKKVMNPRSKLLIQTSQADMIHNGEFDTVYHEHISFFSLRSMQAIAKRAGLIVEHVDTVPVHGTSYLFRLGFGTPDTSVDERLTVEESTGRYNIATYKVFADRARTTVTELKKILTSYKAQGYALVGFGAAAKGNTLLNFGKIRLDYIVDENPLKQGLYTPGMNIPIKTQDILARETKPVVLIPLAWNFLEEIRNKVKKLRPNKDDIFLTYFPTIAIKQ